ncbi:uncharacterized protein LOC130743743 [Lotus japonicus]|uniref:uncharacterized protein LOC130743743 n=1 Tax=Lotus japonicus TaxID=34305 RepID=UPI00258D0D47|nr:uncharacterized protein LOC130743743 [Lotus japonicus]
MLWSSSATGVKPGNMLLALKDVNPQNVTTIRQVYNERMTHIRAKRGQLSEMQHLMRLLEEDRYRHWSRTEEDSTYKTNKYMIPLLEMVGMTSVGFTYTIDFGYMCNEREPEVTWALQKLRGLLLKEEDMPKVMVTDKDISLMNAVTATFPTAAHLLCQFHISKCVKAKCKLTIQDKEMWDDVGDAWNRVMYAESAEEFNAGMDFLRSLVGEHSDLMNYIKETWLPFKHKVEGAHAKLKACIKDSKSDMCAAWAAIHRRFTSTSAPDESQPVLGLSIATELEVIVKMFEKANVSIRQTIKERLREIAYPDQTSMCHPPNKLPTRGRPNEPKGSTRRIPCSWENVDAVLGSKQGSNSSAPQGKGRKTRSTKRKSIPSNQSAPKKRSKRITSKSAQLPPQHPKGKVYSANYIHEVPNSSVSMSLTFTMLKMMAILDIDAFLP